MPRPNKPAATTPRTPRTQIALGTGAGGHRKSHRQRTAEAMAPQAIAAGPRAVRNTMPCGDCVFFDANAMLRAGKETKMGWCAKHSVYPAEDRAGRPAPKHARRAVAGALPEPQIVTVGQIMTQCGDAKARGDAPVRTRQGLLAKTTGQGG